jgi:hypothetical protein
MSAVMSARSDQTSTKVSIPLLSLIFCLALQLIFAGELAGRMFAEDRLASVDSYQYTTVSRLRRASRPDEACQLGVRSGSEGWSEGLGGFDDRL